jgi:hypothetical protein
VDLSVLDPEENTGYLNWVLPSARDAEITRAVEWLRQSGRPRPTPAQRRVLLAFAERMASLARRESSPDRVRAGLTAAALTAEDGGEETRDALLVLPLLWRSAEVLGLDADAEFRGVAADVGRGELVDFAERPPADRAIDTMGYVEVDDEDLGFSYERTW